jgi:hypothetical protein
MALQRCDKGHYYDPESYSSCPSCGVHDLDLQTTQARGVNVNTADGVTQARGDTGAKQCDTGVTVAMVRKKTGMDPVVGWLGIYFKFHGKHIIRRNILTSGSKKYSLYFIEHPRLTG